MIRWLRSLFARRSAYRAYCDTHAEAVASALREALSLQPTQHRYRR